MDAIIVIAGVYIIIKWIVERSARKKEDEAYNAWIKKISKIADDIKNRDLERDLKKVQEYKFVWEHEDRLSKAFSKLYPDGDLSKSVLYSDRWYHVMLHKIIVSIVMSESGFLPWDWQWEVSKNSLSPGAISVLPKRKDVSELIAIGRLIQENLKRNGKNYTVAILNSQKQYRVCIFLKELYSGNDSIDIDKINDDMIMSLW